MNAFDMPTPPEGYVWKVTHRGFDRAWPHIKPLNVFLNPDHQYFSFRRIGEPMAVAWNSPGSVRRAAEKVLARHNRRARSQARDDKEAARRLAVQERYGDLLGEYPPKRLGASE